TSTHDAETLTSPLSLHDALPISVWSATSALGIETIVMSGPAVQAAPVLVGETVDRLLSARARNIGAEISVSVSQVQPHPCAVGRSEEHTSELQSRFDLVCRLLLE